MAIRVTYDAPVTLGVQAAQQVGQSQADTRQRELDDERTRFFARLGEDQRQFDIRTGVGLQEQALNDRRYSQQLAQRDAAQRMAMADRQAQRQAQLAARQLEGQQQLAEQEAQQAYEWQSKQMLSLDDQVKEAIKASQKLQLNPEGKRILNDWMGRVRKVQTDAINLRPGVKNQLLAASLADFNNLGLDAYEQEEPPIEERVGKALMPAQGQQIGPDGSLPPGQYFISKGVRNGTESFELIDITQPDTEVTAAERAHQSMVPYPTEGGLIYNREKKSWEVIAPRKPETTEGHQQMLSSADRVKLFEAAEKALTNQWRAMHTKLVEGNEVQTGPPLQKFIDDNIKNQIARFNRAFGDPDEETLVPSEVREQQPPPGLQHAAMPDDAAPSEMPGDTTEQQPQIIGPNALGRFARKYPDGRVELLPEGFTP